MFQNFNLCKFPSKQWTLKALCSTKTAFKLPEYELYKLDAGPPGEISIDKSEAIHFYTQMAVIRRLEDNLARLYLKKLIRGFCHLYAGEEACCVGIRSCMGANDSCITAYRCHGWTYVMGIPPLQIIAELLGRESGIARGKGGSMHLYTDNFFGGNGIVGAHVPVGTGLALKNKYKKDGGVSVICYGDGASNQGQVFESFNIAKLLNLPALYVIENNHFGMGTSDKRSSANIEYFKRGDYIPGFKVDGMDVLAVKQGTLFAKKHILDGKGPILMEVNTYRYYGHSMSDPGVSYRTREEIQKVRETRDPIHLFKNKLVEAKLATEEELKKIDADVKKDLEDAANKAQGDKEVPLVELTSDIYSSNLMGSIRTTIYDMPREHKRIGPAVNMQ